jgi:RecB family endonuclease NucS
MAASLPGGTLRTVLRTVLTQPSPDELVAFLEEALRDKGAVVQVAGEFEVFYTGRAASVAEAGDYLLLVKPDGSVQVHGPRGVKPVNWQPQTDDVRVLCEDGSAVLVAERFTPPETLRVGFLAPAFAMAFELRDGGGFLLLGSEAEMQAALASDPGVIEPGLTLVDIELPTDVGGIDLLARDASGALVVVELKRGRAGHEAVHQLARYVESVRAVWQGRVRGILAAPAVTAPALNRLGALGLEFREVTALPTLAKETAVQEALF